MRAKIDPATLQTAAGLPSIKSMNESLVFQQREVDELRRLGSMVAEIAALPIQKEKAKLWTLHNDLKTSQPLVFIDPENGWNECIPADTLVCSTPMARVWEMHLRKQIYWFEIFKDDKVIEPFFDVPYSYSDTGWGVELIKEGGENYGAYKIKKVIEDYEEDFQKVHFPKILIDHQESDIVLALANDIFDGILTVRRKTHWWWTLGLTWDLINLRGLEDFMCDLVTNPDDLHKLLALLCDGFLDRLDFLHEGGYLASNNDGTYVGSGGFGYTDELPKYDAHSGKVSTMDMWGFVESQEMVQVSPQMYGEFLFPYHKKIMERFGLGCYGCCESYNMRMDYIKQFPRMRRISVAPWSKWERIEEDLGKNYIASVKPNPAFLAFSQMDEQSARREIKHALDCTKNAIPEIIMKDNNTLGKNPRNASRWVEIVREEIDSV